MMSTAQPFTCWPDGARAAVALSYDDTLPCHHELVAPALEQQGLRATFYAPIRGDLIHNTDAWRDLAKRGHELGNHTLFHPCRREGRGMEDWNNLLHFDAGRLRNELLVASFALQLIDGRTERTFGNTCHDVFIGAEPDKQRIEPILAELFVAARGQCTNRPTDPRSADLLNLGTIAADGKRFNDWRASIEEALSMGGLALFTFHGVGDGYGRIQVDAGEHAQLLGYLRDNHDRLWIAPVIEIARWLRGTTQTPGAG